MTTFHDFERQMNKNQVRTREETINIKLVHFLSKQNSWTHKCIIYNMFITNIYKT